MEASPYTAIMQLHAGNQRIKHDRLEKAFHISCGLWMAVAFSSIML